MIGKVRRPHGSSRTSCTPGAGSSSQHAAGRYASGSRRLIGIERPFDAVLGESVPEHGAAVIENNCIGLIGNGRRTRPDHLPIQTHLFGGPRQDAAATSGKSQPSVSTMQLLTSWVSPLANRASAASRSGFGVEPSICSARTPDRTNSSRMCSECATFTAKQTVFLRSPCLCQVLRCRRPDWLCPFAPRAAPQRNRRHAFRRRSDQD